MTVASIRFPGSTVNVKFIEKYDGTTHVDVVSAHIPVFKPLETCSVLSSVLTCNENCVSPKPWPATKGHQNVRCDGLNVVVPSVQFSHRSLDVNRLQPPIEIVTKSTIDVMASIFGASGDCVAISPLEAPANRGIASQD